MSDNTYFAAKESKACVGIVMSKADNWYQFQQINGLLQKIYSSYRAYHGAYYDAVGYGHEITFGGEQGEFAQIPVNHYRNIAQHLLVMTTSSRPAMEARSTNTDQKSLVQTYLANGILDYYMREKDMETYITTAVEYAVVMGAGYIKLEWDANAGEVYDYDTKTVVDPETGVESEEPDTTKPLYEGDVKFTNLSPFDVVYDTHREDNNHDYLTVRTFKNKYDLAAKYPEFEQKIKGLQTKSDVLTLQFSSNLHNDTTDLTPVYEFYHKKSESVPDGRYILFLTEDIILYDGPMPYRMLPLVRIAAANMLGSPYAYTTMFDLLPLQEAVNSLYSTILTNQNAFGVQNIYVPRGADIVLNQLEGGLNIIEGNQQAGKPEAMNLTNTPKEIFSFMEQLVKDMETLSGVNSVTRGNPEASLKSGTALAMVQSLALQFSSNLQAQYIKGVEQLGTYLIKMLQDFATTKRAIALISGKSNKAFIKEFSSDDLSSISRVVVDVGNPLSRTTSGRLQMGESLLQYQLLKSPQDYLTIVNTGSLDSATESAQTQIFLIRAENEKLMDGLPVQALSLDSHQEHIIHHQSILYDPDLRQNPTLVAGVLAHIQEHISLLQTTDPVLLQMTGQTPIAPPQNAPQPSQVAGPQGTQSPPKGNPAQVMQAPEAGPPQSIQGQGLEEPVNVPNLPHPPKPFQNMPVVASQVNQ